MESIDRGTLRKHGILVACGLMETEIRSVPFRILNVRHKSMLSRRVQCRLMFPVHEDNVQVMHGTESPEHLCGLLKKGF